MATLTIEIPDHLVDRIEQNQHHLDKIIELGLSQLSPADGLLYKEVISFLSKGPTSEEIVNFHPSESVQERVRLLLHKNRAGDLSSKETAELDQMQALNHFFTLLKADAKKALS